MFDERLRYYKTSRNHDDVESGELKNDTSIRKIARMFELHAKRLDDNNAARPPVLGCLHHTLPTLCAIFKPYLNLACRMLHIQDESQECRDPNVIRTLLDNPFIVTVQVSGTFHDMDLEFVEKYPLWCRKRRLHVGASQLRFDGDLRPYTEDREGEHRLLVVS